MKNVMVALLAVAFASVALAQGTTTAAPATPAAQSATAAPTKTEKKDAKKSKKKKAHKSTPTSSRDAECNRSEASQVIKFLSNSKTQRNRK